MQDRQVRRLRPAARRRPTHCWCISGGGWRQGRGHGAKRCGSGAAGRPQAHHAHHPCRVLRHRPGWCPPPCPPCHAPSASSWRLPRLQLATTLRMGQLRPAWQWVRPSRDTLTAYAQVALPRCMSSQPGSNCLSRPSGLPAWSPGTGMDPLLTPRRGADELGGVLQRKFQTSASVTRLPGKADTGKEIALQGNLLHVRPRGAARSFGQDPSVLPASSLPALVHVSANPCCTVRHAVLHCVTCSSAACHALCCREGLSCHLSRTCAAADRRWARCCRRSTACRQNMLT